MQAPRSRPMPFVTAYLHIGMNIRRWRYFKGIKQEHFADKLGISRVTLSRYENGRTEIPVSQLQSIAAALEVSLEQLTDINKP